MLHVYICVCMRVCVVVFVYVCDRGKFSRMYACVHVHVSYSCPCIVFVCCTDVLCLCVGVCVVVFVCADRTISTFCMAARRRMLNTQRMTHNVGYRKNNVEHTMGDK